jgi:hypothetical protein
MVAGELQTQYPVELKAAGGGHVQEDPLETAGELHPHTPFTPAVKGG